MKPPRTLDHPGWYDGYMFSQALTIGGGTGEVQRNIVAERVLGLPHDIDVQQGLSWSEAQKVGVSETSEASSSDTAVRRVTGARSGSEARTPVA